MDGIINMSVDQWGIKLLLQCRLILSCDKTKVARVSLSFVELPQMCVSVTHTHTHCTVVSQAIVVFLGIFNACQHGTTSIVDNVSD